MITGWATNETLLGDPQPGLETGLGCSGACEVSFTVHSFSGFRKLPYATRPSLEPPSSAVCFIVSSCHTTNSHSFTAFVLVFLSLLSTPTLSIHCSVTLYNLSVRQSLYISPQGSTFRPAFRFLRTVRSQLTQAWLYSRSIRPSSYRGRGFE